MKEKFFKAVVKYKKFIVISFLIFALISMLCKRLVSVNYDMNAYLPDNTASTVSIEVMEKEFGGGIPNARVMVSNVTIPEAMELKEKIKYIDGVDDVTWLDDEADITIPIETLDKDVVDTYYKNSSALFPVTINEDKTIKAVEDIRSLIGDDNAMSGAAVDKAIATESTTDEIKMIVLIAVPFTLLILILTTTSWIEPIILLISIGIAIAINSGTNLIFGEISFVTNAAGNILQLAVSLDYSVFLLHRYKEMRKEGLESEEAMVQALCKSTSSILSSGVTTVIGFLALAVMKFKIGPDLGLALAKGIALSLVTVFVFAPGVILYCNNLINKTEHKSFMPSFDGVGKLVEKLIIPSVVIFTIMIIPSYLASINNEYYYGSSKIFGLETKLGQDTKRIEDEFGKFNNYVLMVPRGDFETEENLSNKLKDLKEVTSIISYVDKAGAEVPMEYVDKDVLSKLISDNYSRMIINVKTDYEGKEAFDVVEKIRSTAKEYYGDKYYLAGQTVSTYDLMDTITEDMISVNLLSIGAVFIVLVISMRSISIPAILVLAIETAIWFNLSIPYYRGTPLFYIAYLIISSIQLGATVDYAILMTERYIDFRKKLYKKDAIKKTVSVVMVSILTSGTVMTGVGFFLGYVSSHGILSQLGMLLGRGTICSLGIVVFVVPGLLYVFDSFILRKKEVVFSKKEDINLEGEEAV